MTRAHREEFLPLGHSRQRRRWRWALLGAAGVLLLLLAAARIAAPHLIKSAVNHRLARIEGYRASVDGIDLHLWRGAYQLEGLRIDRRVGERFEPFLRVQEIDFSVAWRELLRARLLSDIAAREVTLAYEPVPEEAEEAAEEEAEEHPQQAQPAAAPVRTPAWQEVIEDLFPIEITRLTITGGRLSYLDRRGEPPGDVSLEELEIVAVGLRNRPAEAGEPMPAHLRLAGTTVGGGRVVLHASLAPLARRPTFDLDLEIRDVALPALNDYFAAYGNVEVSQGTLQLYAEMEARDGRFDGYVKPFFDHVEFADLPVKDENPLEQLWATIVGGLAELLKNRDRDQLATRIPLSGEVGEPDVGLLATLGNVVRHGFIRAFRESLDGEAAAEPRNDQ